MNGAEQLGAKVHLWTYVVLLARKSDLSLMRCTRVLTALRAVLNRFPKT